MRKWASWLVEEISYRLFLMSLGLALLLVASVIMGRCFTDYLKECRK